MEKNFQNFKFENDFQIFSYKKLYTLLQGEHKSFLDGNGLDFKELREYNSSDDVRRINWKVTAKSSKACVNVFNEDKKLNIVFVYLLDGSVYFGSKRSKKETMDEIFANLAYAALNKKDQITTIVYSDKEEYFAPPTQNKKAIKRDLQQLAQLQVVGKTFDFVAFEKYLFNKIKQKSVIFLIGDFLKVFDLRYLAAKHELCCVVVRDKAEEDISYLGNCQLCDLSSNKTQQFHIGYANANKYRELMQAHDVELFGMLKKQKIKFAKIYTHENILLGLSSLIKEK